MIPQGTREQQTHTQTNHITHSQSNLKLSLSDCPSNPTQSWVYQAVGNQATHPSQLIVGFIRLLMVKQTFTFRTSQSNRWVYHTTHSQAISLLGLSGYSAKPTFTIGFIRLSNQGLHTYPNAQQDKDNPTTSFIYQAAQPSQCPFGFHRLPIQSNIQLGFIGCQPSQSPLGLSGY